MTTRQLHDRAKEHLTAARQNTTSSAFGDHYLTQHSSDTPKIEFSILSSHRDNLRLHIQEAMAIKELRPELNRQQEDLGTGFLP